ncbi:MAG: sulfatase-like hydrolase/transferase [Victivallales bacterium]|nr:sulfatase-like hydrolase/transferase [Victivallales bacterium]
MKKSNERKKQNVLWIMTDQHRADCLGCMGHPIVQTPNIDRLAAEGFVFNNAFCQSPVCMASRASLLTGRYPSSNKVRAMGVLPPSETTFQEVLWRNGYATGAFGKVHFTPEQYTLNELGRDTPTLDYRDFAKDAGIPPIPEDPFKKNYGFDTYVGCEDILQGEFKKWLGKCATHLLDRKREPLRDDAPGDLFVSPYPSEFHQSSFIAEKAIEYIESRNDAKSPWMTFCSFIAPHHPFEAPLDQLARYDDADIPLPDPKGEIAASLIPAPASSAISEIDQYSDDVKRFIVKHYLASISLVDDNIGRLINALERTRQMENTIIVFVADHGEFLGNHGLLRKPSLHFDETLRVPLIIRVPDTTDGGRRISGLVELTDVHPTLLGLLDIPINDGVQGIDWSEALKNGDEVSREDIYSDMFDLEPQKFGKRNGPYMAVQTIRTPEWKLNVYPTAGFEYGQLFNLLDDPDETRNLYNDPQSHEIRERMLWRLNSRSHRNHDPLPYWLTQF